METIAQFTRIGQTLKTHGLEGGVLVDIEDPYIELFFSSSFIFLDLNGSIVPFFVEEVKDRNPMLVFLEDVQNPDEAAEIVPVDILLPAEQVVPRTNAGMAADMEFAWLKGFTLYHQEGHPIGEILRIERFPQQEMAVVSYEGLEILMPVHETLISEADREKKTVVFQVPEGLLGLDS